MSFLLLGISIALGFASIIGLVGNFLVIVVTFRKRRNLTSYKALLGHLALCDFSVSLLFCVMVWIIYNGWVWIYPKWFCKFLYPCITLFTTLDVGTILLISIERTRAILQPMQPRWTFRRLKLCLTAIWLIGVSSIIPNSMALTVKGSERCSENWDNPAYPKVYSIVLFAVIYAIPLLVLMGLHIRIMWQMHYNSVLAGVNLGVRLGSRHSQQHASSRQGNYHQRVIKLLLLVTVAFALTVLPAKLFYVIQDFTPHLMSNGTYAILQTVYIIYYYHVVVNPILYAVVDKEFRKNLKLLVCCQREMRTFEFSSRRSTADID